MDTSSRSTLSCSTERVIRPSILRITNVNVDDLERCLAISVDIAPAFEDQALRWLDPSSGKILEPGVRERLVDLINRRTRARAFIDRWGVVFDTAEMRVKELA